MPTMSKQSTVCAAPIGGASTCSKNTKHPSGKCHYHRSAAATGGPGTSAAVNGIGHDPFAGDASADAASPDAPVMWLPESGPPAGVPLGVPVMLADGDVEDSTLTAQRYLDPAGGPDRDMLHLKLTPEGEQKMLDALGLSGTKTVKTVKEVTEIGPHPADNANISGDISVLAQSVNARMKKGEDRLKGGENPQRLEQIKAKLESMKATGGGDGFEAMVGHYEAQVAILGQYMDESFTPKPYLEGGKIGMLKPWEGSHTKTVEESVEVPVDLDVGDALLPTVETQGKRPKPSLENGKSYWGGSMTTADCPPKMWKIDLGDGYSALYYPDAVTNGAGKAFSQKRRMTIIAPKDGNAHGAIERLDRIHLSSAPLTPAGAEWAYLERNAYAMGILSNSTVQQARVDAAGFGQAEAKKMVLAAINDGTQPTDPAEVKSWLRRVKASAESAVLPAKAARLREGVAQALGFGSGESLRSHWSYDPTPKRSQGGIWFDRFQAGPNGPDPTKAKSSYSVNITGGNIADLATNGMAMASTIRRRQMGINTKVGASEAADVNSGGASAVFLSFKASSYHKPSGYGQSMVWSGEQARALSRRTDWYYTSGDHWGATNPDDSHFQGGFSRDFSHLSHASGQMMMEGTIGLVSHPPTWIKTGNATARQQMIQSFADQGVTTFHDGRAVADVIIV